MSSEAVSNVDDALDRLDTSLDTLDYYHYCSHPTGTVASECRVCIVVAEGKQALATVRSALERQREGQRLHSGEQARSADRLRAALERVEAAEAEVQRLREGLRFIAARRIALETFGLGNVADVADRALLADSPDGANPIGWRVLPDGGGAK